LERIKKQRINRCFFISLYPFFLEGGGGGGGGTFTFLPTFGLLGGGGGGGSLFTSSSFIIFGGVNFDISTLGFLGTFGLATCDMLAIAITNANELNNNFFIL
jgi:hypothetical protein